MPAEKMQHRDLPQAPGVATRTVLYVVFGFLAFVALSMTGAHFYLQFMLSGPLLTTPKNFPEPRLQVTPQRDLARYEREQKQKLSSYGWIDRTQGLIHIPIADAMRIIAGRGARAYGPIEQPPASPQPDSSSGSNP